MFPKHITLNLVTGMSENELNNKKEHKEQNSTNKLIHTGTEFGPN